MKQVFISYSRKDYDDFVKPFIADLQDAKIPVWIDQKGLPPGAPDWEQAIRDAIKNAEAVLLVATVNSRKSEVVRDEMEVARMEQIPIYPVWAKGEDGRYADCIPLGYSYRQRVDMREEHYDAGLNTLLRALRGDDYDPVLDRAKHAAQEWDAAGRPDYLLWQWEQQAPVYEVIEQLQPELDEVTRAFLVPEYERLLEEFKDAPEYRRLSIIDRWCEIGEPSASTIVKILSHKSTFDWGSLRNPMRSRLIECLIPFASTITHQVANLLASKEEVIRKIAIETLEQLLGKQALPYLLPALQDESEIVRVATIVSIKRLQAKQAMPYIFPLLQDTDGMVRKVTVEALGQIGDGEVIASLVLLLRDKNRIVRDAAVKTLQKFQYEATPYLIPMFYDDNIKVRQLALEIIEGINDPQSVPFLIDILDDQTQTSWQAPICFIAATALKRIGTPEALSALKEWRKKYPDLAKQWQKYAQHRYRTRRLMSRNPFKSDE